MSSERFGESPSEQNLSTSAPNSYDTPKFTFHGHTSSSSTIMGGFIPIHYQEVDMHPFQEDKRRANTQEPNRLRVPGLNPYEFDPNSPDMGRTYQTSFSDLSNMNRDLPNSRSAQMLSAYSATMDSLFNPRPHEEFGVSAENSASELQHSHSSPEFTPDPFFAGLQKTGANLTTSSQYHAVTIPSRIPSRYGDEQTKRMSRCGHRDTGDEASSHSRAEPPFPTQHFTSFASPSFPTYQPCKAYSQHTPSTFSDNRRSITKELEEVVEHDGSASPTEFSPILGSPEPPLRRSRSPMKKMFGEHGWLGYSPDVKHDLRMTINESKLRRKESSSADKRPTVIGKLRNKLEEIAEKADMGQARNHLRSENGKQQAASSTILSVSIAPHYQARIFMEMELMVVHSANTFLMNEFSHGRFSVETIKKTVDSWKRAGRPTVIEFMYDQITQRDLVAANQQNFRFHNIGPTDSMRVNSMLYNWKQVASTMAIRTFCTADTVILKLIFDIQQILEILGAPHAIMLRLHQIRAEVNEIIGVAKKKRSVTAKYPTFSKRPGQEHDKGYKE